MAKSGRPFRLTRRQALRAGVAGAGTLLAGGSPGAAAGSGSGKRDDPAGDRPPNFLLIISDQLGLDAIAAHGCPDVATPNLDRLVRRGTTFMESHSTNPVCSPARSSIMTGFMPVETGVITNGRPIHAKRRNLGQHLRPHGYDTVYCGKWHLPHGYQAAIDGFDVLPAGQGQGDLSDTVVSNACAAWLKNRQTQKPFLMVASFLQPHDICYWGNARANRMPANLGLPFESLRDQLPALPPNHTSRPPEPEALAKRFVGTYSEDMWRYYLWLYARMIEMLDADVGRILDALEAAGLASDTVVILTADHGDGRGRHLHVSKWYPYDEAVKVPMIVSCPGRVRQGQVDRSHLVCGLDTMPTVCDWAGIAPPRGCQGRSLRPLLEGRDVPWRDCVVSEWQREGRLIRTERYKYARYEGDPVEMLFDMQDDPWETKNLYKDPQHADVLIRHRAMLEAYLAGLDPVEPTPTLKGRPRTRPNKKRA